MGVNSAYASTIPAVFKLVETILNIVVIVLVPIDKVYTHDKQRAAAGWILFVAILSILVSLFFYIIHLTNVIYKLAGPLTLIEFICITIVGILQFVCMIVASATAHLSGLIIATAVMHALSFVIYGIDAFFLFALYKVHGGYLNNPSVAHQPPDMQQQQQYQQQQQMQQYDYPKYNSSTFDNPAYAQ